jgi:hypothetical protein
MNKDSIHSISYVSMKWQTFRWETGNTEGYVTKKRGMLEKVRMYGGGGGRRGGNSLT